MHVNVFIVGVCVSVAALRRCCTISAARGPYIDAHQITDRAEYATQHAMFWITSCETCVIKPRVHFIAPRTPIRLCALLLCDRISRLTDPSFFGFFVCVAQPMASSTEKREGAFYVRSVQQVREASERTQTCSVSRTAFDRMATHRRYVTFQQLSS